MPPKKRQYTAAQKKAYAARMKKRKNGNNAYKPKQKRVQKKKRAPFVEGQKRTEFDVAVQNSSLGAGITFSTNYPNPLEFAQSNYVNAYTHIPINCFTRQSRNLFDNGFKGSNIFSKSLHTRLEIQFPQGADIIVNPQTIYLVHGWVTAPFARSDTTNPTSKNATMADINTWIESQVFQYFNDRNDPLLFADAQKRNLKILGYKRVKPKLNSTLIQPDLKDDASSYGSIPLVRMRASWTINKKYHLQHGTDTTNTNTGGGWSGNGPEVNIDNHYPNTQWLPFMVLYNPTFADALKSTGSVSTVDYRYNHAHYYSDS